MKTRFASLLVLTAALATFPSSSLSASPHGGSAHAVSVRIADVNGCKVTRGTPAQKVLNRFGAPDARLSENVWVYQRFHAVPGARETNACRTLVITFVGREVADIHLVNERAIQIITARLQTGAPFVVASSR